MSYLNQVKQFPMIEESDTPTKQQLIESHLRLVVSIVYKKYHQDHPLADDLIQVGNLALIDSANSYDPTKSNSFSSYAIPWIKMAIMNYVLDNLHQVKTLTTKPIRKAFFNRSKYTTDNRFDKEQMSIDLGISMSDIEEMEKRCATHYTPILTEGESEANWLQLRAEGCDPVSILEDLEFDQFMESDVMQAVDQLNDRERFIIQNRYYVDEPLVLKDLATIFGVSSERIRQIEVDACKRLKKSLQYKYQQCVA